MAYEGYERPETFDEWTIEERLDHIFERLNYIAGRERYRQMRSRFASEEQYAQEFEDDEYLMHVLWFASKADYSAKKEEYDTFLLNSDKSEGYKNTFEAMRRVIDDEIEAMLLDLDEDDSTESI